ncbi:MAG TPA: TIGR02556 family CRISPR-associated protein [Spirochaetota bacterium]|nr:TIGR02556 family CRISPR-associated protein [Spirochaetota bacterium]HPY88148.1 TIGR02556 family CRISPR-associated protein [Spirochaetota bacterium]HQB60143.1 TIGR02556 family CRISPR-associated protein [Spirochaetota bacterium]
MIRKLYNFGKYIPEIYFEDNPLNLNLDYGKEDSKIVFLCFEKTNDIFEYKKIEIEDYDKTQNKSLYLLKNAKGNSVSPFPTLFFEGASINNNQIDFNSKSWGKFLRIVENNSNISENLKNLYLTIKNLNEISLNIRDNFILSIKINGEYIGKSEYYKEIISKSKEDLFNIFFFKHNTESRAKDKNCYLCNIKSEVWGYVDLGDFKFYSSNEDSVIAGGFKKEYSWRNYPVCPECAEKLFKYKVVIERKFNFRFWGFSYYLIPEIVFECNDNNEIIKIITDDKYGLMNLKDKIETEEEIYDILKSTKNFITFNLFFYEKNNSEFKIIMSIDDVFPSRFRKMSDVKKEVENINLFKNIEFKKNEIKDLKFSFGVLKHFFPASKIEGDFSKYFLEITRAIFSSRLIDYEFVIARMIDKIRTDFLNDYPTYYDILTAMMLIEFISKLNLWNKKENIKEKEIIMDGVYQTFFDEHKDFFNSNTKKAIFLEGVLCQFLLDIQYRDRNATPFKSRLNGLKIDEQIIKRLLPEIINKLEEYKRNYYRELESLISEYLLESKFDMTNDEISFYFVMGMNLAKKFKTKKDEELENGSN